MSSTNPALHFVRCPKCLKVLREPPGVSLYGCGGCGAILRAKSHFSSQETMSLASAASSSKNMLNSGSFDNEIIASGINNGVEFSGNEVKNHAESKSNIGNLEEEKKSHVEENQPPTKTESGLNEKEKESSNQEISKANGSFRSDNTLEESTESPEHDIMSEDDEVNGKMRNDRRFLLRSSSSHAYDGSISSTGVQARNRDFSFVSEDFHSALNFTGSIDSANSESQSKAAKQFVKFRQPEKSDQARILRKVDELRNELRVLFNRAADGKGVSAIDSSAHFQGKVSPNQCRALHHHQESGRCNEHCRSCLSNVRCNLPEVGASIDPLRPSLHRGTQTREPIIKKPQEVKRRCRPVSGGAPFVICYRCYSVLQLPSDFLVSTKRVHKLRCGSCSEVLRYTFIPRTRSNAQTPSEVRLPPSEDDEKVAAPHSNCSREGDPVSYSEEYEPSFVKSNSFEAKKSPLLGRNYGAIVEEEHGGKRSSGARLHKLMGYSSARHLLFETLSPVEGQRTEHDR